MPPIQSYLVFVSAATQSEEREVCFALSIWNYALIVRFSSAQDGIYALGKAHMRSTTSLRNFPDVTFEMVLLFV